MARYAVIWEEREVGGFGRRKDQTKKVLAPMVRHKSGEGIRFRSNQGELAELVCDALNKHKVQMQQPGDDMNTPFISGKYAKATLRDVGYRI